MAWRVPWPWTLSVSRMPLQIVGRDSETYTTLDGNPHAQVAPSVVTADLADGTIGLSMRPFQVATLRLGRNR